MSTSNIKLVIIDCRFSQIHCIVEMTGERVFFHLCDCNYIVDEFHCLLRCPFSRS